MAPKPPQPLTRLLIFVGLVLLGLCVGTVIRNQDTLAGVFAVLGLGTIVLAALLPRLEGPVEMSLSGFKFQLSRLAETGRTLGYSEEDILAAIEIRLRRQNTSSTQEPPGNEIASEAVDGENPPPVPDQLNLAIALEEKYSWSHDIADFEKALATGMRALEDAPPQSPHRSSVLGFLGMLLLKRARAEGNVSVENHALAYLREALGASAMGSPQYQAALKTLASAAQDRLDADQDEVIAHLDELESARRTRSS
jgi:hypothetical protein